MSGPTPIGPTRMGPTRMGPTRMGPTRMGPTRMGRPARAAAGPVRRALVAALLVAALLGAGCGSATGTAGHPTVPSTSTPTSTTTTTVTIPVSVPPTRPTGPATSDQAAASGTGAGSTVTLSSGGSVRPVTSAVALPHGSGLTASGAATADLTFAHTSACALQSTGGFPGRLTTRVPPTALLQLTQGVVICTIPAVAAQVRVCGGGVVFANGTTQSGAQFVVTCDPDPRLSVAVLDGAVAVVDPSGEHLDVGGGQQMSCDPTQCQSQIGGAGFTEDQMAIFAAQSDELHWVPPTTTTSTSTSTTSSTLSTLGPTTTTTTTTTVPGIQ